MENQICEESKHDVPYELILEIFSKLPVKSLCRFKCVSTSLHSSIKAPVFVEKTRPKNSIQWQIVDKDKGELSIYSIDDSNNNGVAAIMRKFDFGGKIFCSKSCNGLFCYQGYKKNFITLFNPTTAKSIALPKEFHNLIAVDFDPITDKYNVLGCRMNPRNNGFGVEIGILTLGQELSWKPVKNTPFELVSYPVSAINANGSFFWFHEYKQHIVFFNLHTQEFGWIYLPGQINRMMKNEYSLFEFEGNLCLVELNYKGKPMRDLEILNLWMLVDIVNSVWLTVMTNVAPFENAKEFIYPLGYCRMFAQSGEILMRAYEEGGGGVCIFSYSFLNGQFTALKLMEFPHPPMVVMESMAKHVENHLNIEEFVRRSPTQCGSVMSMN